ncbi:MAG: hypothetical protein LOD92_02190 [Bacillales bacterium]
MRFFIVDDSDSDRSLLRNMIEEEIGTVVGEAADGSEISIDILKEKEDVYHALKSFFRKQVATS